MSPTNPNLIQLTGRYLECASCHAPDCDPVPERWLLTVQGRSADCIITPHLPTCRYLRSVRDGGPA